jgi:hypothetical protein
VLCTRHRLYVTVAQIPILMPMQRASLDCRGCALIGGMSIDHLPLLSSNSNGHLVEVELIEFEPG